jgi:hypothetical protein
MGPKLRYPAVPQLVSQAVFFLETAQPCVSHSIMMAGGPVPCIVVFGVLLIVRLRYLFSWFYFVSFVCRVSKFYLLYSLLAGDPLDPSGPSKRLSQQKALADLFMRQAV